MAAHKQERVDWLLRVSSLRYLGQGCALVVVVNLSETRLLTPGTHQIFPGTTFNLLRLSEPGIAAIVV